MKIIAVGWNYMEHNRELNRVNIPTHPVIFMKPETALVRDNKPFFLPSFSNQIEYETEIVLRISKMGKNISEKFADRYFDAVGLGIDFTARDLQNEFKQKGIPWEICKAFDNSAPISQFMPKEEVDIANLNFSLNLNEKTVQKGNTSDMIFKPNQIISYISQFFTLKTGDLIFTGTPVGVGSVKIGDHLEGFIENNKMLDFHVC